MATTKHRSPHRPLSFGRPPKISKKSTNISSRATRSIIRKHHTLQKQLAAAIASNDVAQASSLEQQINASGGLERYQQASMTGQLSERGGDSSKVLVEWFTPLYPKRTPPSEPSYPGHTRLRMLEVGALKTDNACSRCGLFDVTRIDLHSRNRDVIEEQDFMERPAPIGPEALQTEGFDVVSLSLVVNYVGNAERRGEMLRRVKRFLRPREATTQGEDRQISDVSPALFLVLPASCVLNSRYIDEDRLGGIMGDLGFSLVRRKATAKLVYYLWKHTGLEEETRLLWKKENINPGKTRNNFAIVIR